MRAIARLILRVASPADAAVLDEMASIPEAALRRWVRKQYMTVLPLAIAELARRGLTP